MSLESGIQSFRNKDYAQAFSILKSYADQGDPEAQCMIANMYHLGLGMEKDGSKAVKWYTKSAQQGYPVASNNLAGIYLIGDCGVPIDQQAAARWYKLSQEQGFLQNKVSEEPAGNNK